MSTTSTTDASQVAVSNQSGRPSSDSSKSTAVDFQTDAVSSAERCSPWLLFAMPVGLGLFLGMVVTAINVIQSIDAKAFYLGLDGLRPVILFAFVGLTSLVFALCCFRPKLKTLTLGIAAAVSLGAFCFNCVRVESFYGNMIPKLTWSWKPTIEEEVDAFFVSRELKESETLLLSEVDAGLFAESERDFPGLLGSDRNGVLADYGLETDWDANAPQLLWEHPVGLGWSSFAVVGQAAITLEQRGELECVVCYNLLTGTEIWVYGEVRRFYDEHGDGPRSTPTIADGKVYTIGADGLLCCLELSTGELLWSQDVLRDTGADNLLWGMSGCPLVFEDKVIVTPGGKAAAAVCFDATTGDELWRTGEDMGAYSSPTLATVCGTEQVLSFNGEGLRAFDTNGQPTWLVPWITQGEMQRVNVAQPIVLPSDDESKSQVLISSGYGRGTALIEVTKEGDNWQSEQLWLSNRLKSKMSNFVVHDGYVYGLDSGILACVRIEDGKRVWKGGRYGHGQLLLVGEQLLIQAESGKVVMVEATPEKHHELGQFDALSGKTWNHLALAGNILVVRNDHRAAAYELPLATSSVQ